VRRQVGPLHQLAPIQPGLRAGSWWPGRAILKPASGSERPPKARHVGTRRIPSNPRLEPSFTGGLFARNDFGHPDDYLRRGLDRHISHSRMLATTPRIAHPHESDPKGVS